MAIEKALTTFIREELKPRLFNYIPRIFSDFKRKGSGYQSPLHWDGSEGTGERPDRSVITEKYPYTIYDQTRGSKDIITAYMTRNGITETWEAVNRLCDVVGIDRPESTPQQIEYYKKAEEKRNALEASAERQQKALFTPQGREVLEYLHGRGLTDVDIKEEGFGYLSEDEAKRLPLPDGEKPGKNLGTLHTLSIPLRSGSTLYGLKFRATNEKAFAKYVNLKGSELEEHLFNLPGIQQTDGFVVVVEGELDVISAKRRGVKGLVATCGCGLTEQQLDVALKRGIKHFTFLFDTDEAGMKYTESSIKLAHKKGISVLVATLTDENGNPFILSSGKPVKDVGDFLTEHTGEELQAIINRAKCGSIYLLEKLIDEAQEQEWTDGAELRLREKVISLANHAPDEAERFLVLNQYANAANIDGNQAFTAEALRAVADKEQAAEDERRQKDETGKAIREAQRLFDNGDTQGALRKMAEASVELPRIANRAKFSHLLAPPSESNLRQSLRKKLDEIPTDYELSNGKEKELLTLPSGALTFICAGTTHGKSTFLQNLALQVAQSEGDGIVLYFSYEEDGDEVALQMLNKYVNTELCRNYNPSQSNNIKVIRHYFKTGEDRYIAEERRQTFHEKEREFFDRLYNTGKLRVYFEIFTSEDLIEAIRTIGSQTKIKAVFIDYIQQLSSRKYNRLQRREELKEMSNDLKNLAIDMQLPIVAAAQLNREACSPLDLHSQKMADSADLERIANKILCLWNTCFEPWKTKDSTTTQTTLTEWADKHNAPLGDKIHPKIYAKLTKNRGGVAGIEAVLDFNGNTGIIKGNINAVEPAKPQPQPTQTALFNSAGNPF